MVMVMVMVMGHLKCTVAGESHWKHFHPKNLWARVEVSWHCVVPHLVRIGIRVVTMIRMIPTIFGLVLHCSTPEKTMLTILIILTMLIMLIKTIKTIITIYIDHLDHLNILLLLMSPIPSLRLDFDDYGVDGDSDYLDDFDNEEQLSTIMEILLSYWFWKSW